MKNISYIQKLRKLKKVLLLFSIIFIIHFYSHADDTIFSDTFSGSYPGSWYIGHDGGGGSYSWAWPDGYAHEYSNPSGGMYYYPDDLHVYMERRYVNLSGYSSASLTFYYIVDSEPGYDYFTVNVRDQSGNWHEMFRASGEHDLTWVSQAINLDQFAGQSGLYIQFRFDSDGSVSGDPYNGVYVDNVQLTAGGSGDIYEPDNSYSQANEQPHNTCSVSRSIDPADDQDWIYFDLTTTSNVIINSYGPSGDSRMWLYDSSLNQIEYDDDDGDGAFSKIERLNSNALPPGRYYVKIDEYGNNNIIPEYFLDLSVEPYTPAIPDLEPYLPSGWDDKIVVSNTTGTSSNTTIYANQTAYLDFAVANTGNGDTGGGFYVELWDDTTGERILRGYRSSSLAAGYYFAQEDSQWTFSQDGWHTIRVKVDADSNISESDEGDNEYTRQVYIYPQPTYPDLAPYKPSGWTSEIVLSAISGTNTDSTVYVSYATYIDYAVINSGNEDTGVGFYVELWDDTTGERIRRGYYSSSLSAGYYYTQEDSQWTFTQAGWHTIRIIVDADNDVSNESNEGNNEYTRQVYVTNVVINENEIPGASNNPSSVPTYLNDNNMYNIGTAGNGGICFATAMTDILAYWDRNPYNGVTYWNLVDCGKAPLTQNVLPQSPGHNQADVRSLVINIGTRYYINNQAQDSIVEDVCNVENNLSFDATFFNPVTLENDKINYFNTITVEIDAGRPIKAASLGTYFGGAHAIPVIGYKEFADPLGNDIYIHVNQGNTDSEYVNFFESSWGGLNLVRIVPGGTPNDHYEDLNGQDDDSQAHAKWLDPEDVYEFRQTHNFKAGFLGIGNDSQDWVKFNAIAGRQYTIETRNLGDNCDTKLMVDWDGATYCIFNDDGGDEPRASKIVWDCAANTTVYVLITDYYERVGHDTNYDVEVTYINITVPQTPIPISPYDNEYIYTLSPMFEWSAFQDGGNGATQAGYHLRVRCDTDGDTIVYDTGFVPITSLHAHVYTAGAYVGYEPVSGVTRISDPLLWGKHYHWHVRYLDSNGRWSAWSSDDPNPHQDFYTQLLTFTLNVSISPSEGGSVTKNPDKSSYIYNEVVQLTAIPASGYVFIGWSGDASGTANPLSVAMNSNKTITANFTPITYTLNVSVNPSGSGSVTKNPDKSYYNHNEIVQLTAAPAAGYTFSGWSGDVISTANPVSVMMNADKYITANFTPITYTLNVNVSPSGGGSVTKNPNKSSYNYNEVVQLTATPASGYTFFGWSGDASGTANPLSVTMNSNKNITANFTPITHTLNVIVNPSGSGSVTKNPNKTFYNHNEIVQLTATPASGYTFSGWSGDASGTENPLSVTMNSDKSITANFSPITYTLDVNINPSGGGSVTKNPNKSSYNYNEVVQLTATPASGYTFFGWSGDASGTANPLFVTMNSNKSITANFSPVTHTLSVNVNPSGSGSVTKDPNKSSYNHNEVVQLTATPEPRYTFSGWSGDAAGTLNPLSVTMDSNKTITANFTPMTYTLSVNVNPSGSGSVTKNPDKSSYDYNEVVQLTAIPASGYTFSGWSGDAAGTENPLSVTMNSNKSITANFTPISSDGNLSVVPADGFSSSGAPGGPFIPQSKNYTVTNTGGTSIDFTVTKNAVWITLSNTGQTLSPDESVLVTVSINNNANSLNVGTYNDSVIFTNTTNGNGNTSRNVDLNIAEQPMIIVTSPNGGETLEAGSIYTITWTSTGTISNVTIEYSTNSGASWSTIVSATANTGSHNWTVPGNPSENCLVRISGSDSDEGPKDMSDAVFSIISSPLPALKITSPNGGEKLTMGSLFDITWASNGPIGDVKIEYSIDNGTSWAIIVPSTDNDGSYTWTVPDNPSESCLVRISESDKDGGVSDISDGGFFIVPAPFITVTSPNGGDTWEVGVPHNITWNSSETIGNIKIEYSANNGTSWTTIAASIDNSGSFNWTVPGNPSENCLIRLSEAEGDTSDVSDGVFSIVLPPSITVTSPNGGENWPAGSKQDITWSNIGTIGNVKIEYSTDNGTNWKTIAESLDNNGSYNWTVPDNPSDNCLIRISESDKDGGPSDISDAPFSITPAPVITITSPNGREKLAAESTHEITWTSSQIQGEVKIEYSTDNGASWINIVLSTINDGSHSWSVPDNPSETCLIRISETDGEPSDVSDSVFSIVSTSTSTITVTSPNGGENVTIGETYDITWTSTGMDEEDTVIIEYSTDNGISWLNIVPSTANIGSYHWTVPDNPSENCKIRIVGSDSDDGPSDVSDSVFSIVSPSTPTITVTSPNGGESLTAETTHEITWVSSGMENVENIIIEYSTDSGTAWTTIVFTTSDIEAYSWTVPGNPSDNCLIRTRVSDSDEGPSDVSDEVFSIVSASSITVTSPNGGEKWKTGSTYNITWTSTGITGDVVIDLYSGSSFDLNIGTIPVESGSFAWDIPGNFTIGDDYKILLHKDSIEDDSDANFSIVDKDPNHPDFNNDGNVDILWRNYATGYNEVWLMNGSLRANSSSLPEMLDLNWKVVGTGDFNRDGKVDILWRNDTNGQNQVWYMDGITQTGFEYLLNEPGSNWKIVGTGDFNGDARVDIVWRNALEGRNMVWYMDGITRIGISALPKIEGQSWQIVGTGDFNGDHKVDILWRNDENGSSQVWYMDGVTRLGTADLIQETDLDWRIVGTGDFNLDGSIDILWRRYSDGQNKIWYMSGVVRVGYESIETRSDLNWRIVNNGD